ncbi:hypothetical protein QEH59_01210 [Coraliomargarita sp. SDUM461004]|uniref:Molecular chaperone n=1 Tax=Thalassobacterium sedimentorum TaxID=3041258 RepID=A0ABU1AES9_9BACT|nr:hypothetical protein [Coraliomargarita sp. SDUM461004]MDQ8193024.1 hypothetical protein [Coraliomargarita sp. SDUM461004]
MSKSIAYTYLFWSLLSILGGQDLVAQEGELFKAKLRFFNPIADIRELYFISDGKDQEIRASFVGPSKRYEFISETPELVLFVKETFEGEIVRTPVARVMLPVGGDDCLVFMVPNKANDGERYRTKVFNNSLRALGKGETRIHNMTTMAIMMKYGNLQFQIDGESSKTMPTQTVKDSSGDADSYGTAINIDFPVLIAMNTDSGWRSVYRSIWYPMENDRIQVFIMPQSKTSVRVFQITD